MTHHGIDTSSGDRCPLADQGERRRHRRSSRHPASVAEGHRCRRHGLRIAKATRGRARRRPTEIHRIADITANPPMSPTTGERSIGARTLSRMLCHFTVAPARPPRARLRQRPPISACDDDDGIPATSEHVPADRPDERAGIYGDPGSYPWHLDDVRADGPRHPNPGEPIQQVHDRREHAARSGGQGPRRHRGRDGVRRVMEAVRVREAQRQDDDERDGDPSTGLRTPGRRSPRP